MEKSLTVYAENEAQLTKLKALMLSLDIPFKENEYGVSQAREMVSDSDQQK